VYVHRMTNEIVKREPALPVSDDIVVLARDPAEMNLAQKGLIAWMDRKVAGLKAELAEAEENLTTAKRMKVRTEGWRRVITRSKNRITYYEKARAALDEGYCIIPDLPVQLIAIRTTRKKPPKRWHQGGHWQVPEAKALTLPEGEGRYVDSSVEVVEREVAVKDKDYTQTESQAVEFLDVDFPFKVVKPQILLGLEAAMKRKLFDEIGVLPATQRGADPILVGRIKQKEGYNERVMTFLIAWWIDTSDL